MTRINLFAALAASMQLRNIVRDLERGEEEEALLKARDFRAFTLDKHEDGGLRNPNGSEPPTTPEAVTSPLNGISERMGGPASSIP